MSTSKRRNGTASVGKGSIAMALLAVVSLAATVLVAQRTLSDASEVVVRGEADALVTAVVADLLQQDQPPTSDLLERELSQHAAKGLRYVALVEHEGMVVVAEAGTPQLADAPLRPGEATVQGHRVRATGVLPVPRGAREFPGFPPSRRAGRREPPALVVELEPPIIARLRAGLSRIALVASIAGGVLLAFAVGWSRTARRLAEVEQRAAREQRLVALGGMSSVMAHELRNPLASLKGHAQLLAEDLTDVRQKTKADRVVADAERLERLTTSLLDFVRDGPMERTAISPMDLVAQSLEHLPRERVRVRLEGAPAALVVDPGRLSRAVHNLVDNALKATNGDEPVELSVSRDGRDVVIAVRDRGPGLPASGDAQIFEPFVTTRVRGTGLGLPVARRIAEQHGGTLGGETHPDGGAVFRLRLPVEIVS